MQVEKIVLLKGGSSTHIYLYIDQLYTQKIHMNGAHYCGLASVFLRVLIFGIVWLAAFFFCRLYGRVNGKFIRSKEQVYDQTNIACV